MAIAILSITSAVAIPSYTRYLASTSEKVCFINRQSILYEYQLYCISDPEISFSEYMSMNYPGYEDHLCPSGGIYIANGSGDTAELICSVHRD
jgi:hypothetical protein